LVEYGFRLPSAMDNRPLTYPEFEGMMGQSIFVSATPGEYEIKKSEGVVVEQIIRPTGLLDPIIEVRPTINQIDDLLGEIDERIKKNERVLITTITKRMAVELDTYLHKVGIKSNYIHSEVKTLDRVEILRSLRLGVIDVIVGVNLLREGLDLPEVSLVFIMDADKEGFLRDQRSMIQTIGRAARNSEGKVIMYADKMTDSMNAAIGETNRRRARQEEFNTANGITPTTVRKSIDEIMELTQVADSKKAPKVYALDAEEQLSIAADPVVAYMGKAELEKLAAKTQKDMESAAKELNFVVAARIRDELNQLKELIKKKS